MAVLLRSQLECPSCGDLIASIRRHDFQTCSCGGLSIDGGRDYLRVAYNDEVGKTLLAEGGMKSMDRSISISGPHNDSSAALALAIYKALWAASQRGAHSVLTEEVRMAMRKPCTKRSLLAYLKALAADDGPVEQIQGQGYKWFPRIPLAERPDAP